jgi:[ribosomal protein S18]-alanine N-acetyltransferase
MENIIISEAVGAERDWTARMIASSEPWITLGTTLETCLKFCHDPEYKVFVARIGNDPCGSMVVHPRGLASSPYLKSIVVDSRFRSRGIGRKLLGFAEDYFRNTSKHFFMCVSSFNPRARDLYERLGYTMVGEFHDYILEGESEILLHKRLK